MNSTYPHKVFRLFAIGIILIMILTSAYGQPMLAVNSGKEGKSERAEKMTREKNPPNVPMIIGEDHSAQLGSYGDEYVRTPTLDRLAAEGARFENACATQAGCSPSRASILTGLYPHQHGQMGLATHKMQMFDENTPNLPAILGEFGYRTGNIGKIHVNPESTFRFDYHRKESYNRFGKRDMEAVAKEAEAFLNSGDPPFYLQVNYADAHLPFLDQQFGIPEHPYTAEEVGSLPFVGLHSREVLEQTADYYSCMARLDRGVNLLLQALKETGELENTLIIYLSDHGAPMPRGKKTSYEGGVHIPLIMWKPDKIQSGLVRDELVSTVDLMPSILDFAGISAPDMLAGRSLRPLLDQDPKDDASWRQYLFTEFTLHWPETFFPQRTVRDDRYKLIVNMLPDTTNPIYKYYMVEEEAPKNRWWSGEDPLKDYNTRKRKAYELWKNPPRFELYDLKKDRWEWNNLAGMPEYDEVQNRLLNKLREWQKKTGDELRHPAKLEKLKREVASTFINGEYIHLRYRPEFTWQYTDYLRPDKTENLKFKDEPDDAFKK